jgi:hypothetical protein
VTLKLCAEPAGVMEQEAALVHALEAAARVQVTPNLLTVFDSADRIVIVANR